MTDKTDKTDKKEEKTEKTEEEILFPNVKVGDYEIKPWSFGMLFELSPMLDEIFAKAKDRDLMVDLETGFISYTTMARLFSIASDQILKIIEITLDIDTEEVKSLDMTDGIKIAIAIYKQNSDVLKNAFSLLLQEIQTKDEKEKETENTKS